MFSNIIEDTRSMFPEIIIECSLPRYTQLGAAFRPRSKVTITSHVYGTFSIEIDQYLTDLFQDIINSDSPVEVSIFSSSDIVTIVVQLNITVKLSELKGQRSIQLPCILKLFTT